jgi:SHS2 domain-containing protein
VTYRWVDHTAEVGLEVEAPSAELVLADAMHALAELLDGGAGPPETREIRLEAADLATLLVAWLEELLFLADTAGFVPEGTDLVLRDTKLDAVLHGRTTEPRPLVKAVTYHELVFEPAGDGWRAKVVFDV